MSKYHLKINTLLPVVEMRIRIELFFGIRSAERLSSLSILGQLTSSSSNFAIGLKTNWSLSPKQEFLF